MAFAALLLISGTVQAGIKITNSVIEQNGNPQIQYDFSVYLDAGSTLAPGSLMPLGLPSYFTLNNLAGINPLAVVTISKTPSGVSWSPVFGIPHTETLTVQEPNGAHVFKNVVDTSVTFGYLGLKTFTNNTGKPKLLGNFTITELKSSIPMLPEGSSIATTYSYQIKNASGTNVSVLFTAAPEPSSLVVVALVGSSLMGVGLLRRWRRAA